MLTPLDIENKKFSKQMVNGYNVDDVDDFLDEVTDEYQKMYKELSELNSRIEEQNSEMQKYKSIEGTLQDTLVMAQSTAEEVKKVAKQQAEQIVKDAEVAARTEVEELNAQIILKTKELEELKKKFEVYKAKMESLLISQLELLKEITEDYNYN